MSKDQKCRKIQYGLLKTSSNFINLVLENLTYRDEGQLTSVHEHASSNTAILLQKLKEWHFNTGHQINRSPLFQHNFH